ncbi:hypothetical protein D3C72_1388350 [compost metagenome]
MVRLYRCSYESCAQYLGSYPGVERNDDATPYFFYYSKYDKMKRLILSTLLSGISMCLFAQSQTYTYYKKKETLLYRDQAGDMKQYPNSSSVGKYEFVFENNIQDGKPLFTLYNNGIEDQWYSEMKNLGNQEKGGEIFHTFLYFATTSRIQLAVMYTLSRSKMVMIYEDKFVEYSN